MHRYFPAALVLLALGLAATAGPSAWGRLALRLGFPDLAAALIRIPRWQGVALYEAGHYAEADEAFARAGRGSTYNRGNTLAMLGNYPLAVAYYEAVLYVDPADTDALANRALLMPLLPKIRGDTNGSFGKLSTETAPDAKSRGGTYEMNIQQRMRDRPKLPRPSDIRQSVDPGLDWLAAIPDDPGKYIKLRIAAEHQRRVDSGTAARIGDDPW